MCSEMCIRDSDKRGYFSESYNKQKFLEYGVSHDFVQDNYSLSVKEKTLRGLHFQAPPHAQAKLIKCIRGKIFDVAIDIRLGSPSFGKWKSYLLSAENGSQLYIPIGFAHGFLTLDKNTEIAYKCSDFYCPQSEGALHWNDPDLGINWPLDDDPLVSEKDNDASFLREFSSPFILGENS